jgi:hypothetical protein
MAISVVPGFSYRLREVVSVEPIRGGTENHTGYSRGRNGTC